MLSFMLMAVVTGGTKPAGLVGAWTTKVQFQTGAFAPIKDLEFMIVFNQGGTMTESSNYDGAPPVPPAYGIWKKTATNRFEAKYTFYNTKPPVKFDEISSGAGWMPNGKGTLIEKITLASNGQSYESLMTLKMFDSKGKPGELWRAKCRGIRMRF